MQYYAKTNTASPATGFITVGEILTEKQAGALGGEKLAELVKAGVLGVCGGEGITPKAHEAEPAEATPEEPGTVEAESAETAEEEPDGEELPELDVADELVKDTPAKAAAPKNGGRRKAK